jgi:hypothetical protein
MLSIWKMSGDLESSTVQPWERDLPMAYIPTMNTAVDRLAFFHVLESLKVQHHELNH